MDAEPPRADRAPRHDGAPMVLAMALFVLTCLLLLAGAAAAIVIGVVAPG